MFCGQLRLAARDFPKATDFHFFFRAQQSNEIVCFYKIMPPLGRWTTTAKNQLRKFNYKLGVGIDI